MISKAVIGTTVAALTAGVLVTPAVAADSTAVGAAAVEATSRAVQQQQVAVRTGTRAQAARPAAATHGLTAQQAAARQAAAARTARLARDMTGIMPSLYRGKYFSTRYEPTRKCIIRRESRGHYRAENPRSSAAGAYQFLLSTSNHVARTMKRPDLVGVPASRWNRLEQDQAFWTLWDHGRGRGHWAGGHYSC